MIPQINNRGFTLIELLVVIAIIGVLSSVVMVALNSARGKGADSSTKSNLSAVRTQAEVVNSTTGSYATVCADSTVRKAISAAAAAQYYAGYWLTPTDNSADVTCTSASGTWLSYVHMNKGSGKWWCVDSVGKAKALNVTPGATATVCP